MEAGWTVVWLWGTQGPQNLPGFGPIQQRQLAARERVWFVDADAGRFGIPLVPRLGRSRHAFERSPVRGDRECAVVWCDPTEFHANLDGLAHPFLVDLDDGREAERRSLLGHLQAGLAKRRRHLEIVEAALWQRAAAIAAKEKADPRRQRASGGLRRQSRPLDLSAPVGGRSAGVAQQVLAATGAESVVAETLRTDDAVYVNPKLWHTFVVRYVHAPGGVTLDELVAAVAAEYPHNREGVRTAVYSCVERLRRTGLVRREGGQVVPLGTYRRSTAPGVRNRAPSEGNNGQLGLPL